MCIRKIPTDFKDTPTRTALEAFNAQGTDDMQERVCFEPFSF